MDVVELSELRQRCSHISQFRFEAPQSSFDVLTGRDMTLAKAHTLETVLNSRFSLHELFLFILWWYSENI